MSRKLQDGIYAPLPCFFDENEEVDYDSYAEHVKSICKHGIMPVVSGSMGEAIHLTPQERIQLIKTARAALDQVGLNDMAIMAGAGAWSTRETITRAQEAAEAGADQVIVIPPGYYAGSMTSEALEKFYLEVAAGSPLPVMIYNFPAVTGGINMSSHLIENIAKNSSNIAGTKLTCASVSKLGRIAQNSKEFGERTTGRSFLALAGFVDFLLPAVVVGGGGAITGVPNFAPRTCQQLWELCQMPLTAPNLKAINKLHLLVSEADSVASNANIPGMKALLHHLNCFPPYVRGPLLTASEEEAKKFFGSPAIQAILEYESKI